VLVLAVDPGMEGAVSAYAGDRFLWSKRVTNDKAAVLGVLQWAQREAPKHGGLTVVVERQFQGRGAKMNPSTTETLMRSRFLWEILSDVLGIEVVLVWPSSWQSKTLCLAPPVDEKGKKLNTTKKQSIWVAKHFVKDQDWSDGEADSALIGRWHVKQRAKEAF
jgi:hypothetical protein